MNDSEEKVILVDENDKMIGLADKLDAHRKGLLHRAFSVLLFDPQKNILLQQRAMTKYHSKGVWTNACCSHPRPNENIMPAAHRRLQDEMNFDCALHFVTTLHYQTPPLDTGLIENELLHLIVGQTTQRSFIPNPSEVMDWRWISLIDLKNEICQKPESFSYWFRLYLDKFDFDSLIPQQDVHSV
jgi:isopentenyl-diphosphate delta-isomerase